MIEELKQNPKAATMIAASVGVLLLATALQGCQLEDLVKVDVPKDVAAAIKSEDRISYSDSPAAWHEWQAYVDRSLRPD
jgi:hypothetical protein